ncbi:MAG: MurR/RpiR family transcriptional regulator [Sphaerochaetaceae bacterium]|jgi:DNA-binding MurR/RpiR family transcriptional regulator
MEQKKTQPSDILERIKLNYHSFSRKRRMIADYVLSNVSTCGFLSLKEFSAAAQVTEVTVLSFCKQLGYDSFVELKKSLQEYVLFWIRPDERFRRIANRDVDVEDFLRQLDRDERDIIRETFMQNTASSVSDFIGAIKAARKVFVAGHGLSSISSAYCVYRMLSLGVDIAPLNLQDTHLMVGQLAVSKASEVLVIAISMPPYGKVTLATASMCKKEGIPLIAITDSRYSPLVPFSSRTLICPSRILGVTNSVVSVIAMIDLISMLFPGNSEDRSVDGTDSGSLHERHEELLRCLENCDT